MIQYLRDRRVQVAVVVAVVVAVAVTVFVVVDDSDASTPEFADANVYTVEQLATRPPAGFTGKVLSITVPAGPSTVLPAGFEFHPASCQPGAVSVKAGTVSSGVQLTSASTRVFGWWPRVFPMPLRCRRRRCGVRSVRR